MYYSFTFRFIQIEDFKITVFLNIHKKQTKFFILIM